MAFSPFTNPWKLQLSQWWMRAGPDKKLQLISLKWWKPTAILSWKSGALFASQPQDDLSIPTFARRDHQGICGETWIYRSSLDLILWSRKFVIWASKLYLIFEVLEKNVGSNLCLQILIKDGAAVPATNSRFIIDIIFLYMTIFPPRNYFDLFITVVKSCLNWKCLNQMSLNLETIVKSTQYKKLAPNACGSHIEIWDLAFGQQDFRFNTMWTAKHLILQGAAHASKSTAAKVIQVIFRECVRNLNLRVHPGEWISKQRVHIVLEASKSAGAKADVPKICGFVHPLHPL